MDWNCLLAAIFFFAGNIMWIVYHVLELTATQNESKINFMSLEPSFIKSLWGARNRYQALEVVTGGTNVAAWFCMGPALLHLLWILSLGGKRRVALHTTATIFVVTAVGTEVMSLLFELGMSNITEFITKNMNLSHWLKTTNGDNDNLGWRSIELISMMFSGMTLWVECFEYLALFFVLLFVYMSANNLQKDVASRQQQLPFTFGYVWAHFGLFIGLLAGVDFVAQVLRPIKGALWRSLFTEIGLILGIVNRLLLLPVWLICLGKQLSVATYSIEMVKQQQQQQQPQQDGHQNTQDDFVIVS